MRHRFWGFIFNCAQLLTKQITVLFKPQGHKWNEHFQIEQGYILGKTTIGRTTIFLLKLNEPKRLMIRQALILQKLYP